MKVPNSPVLSTARQRWTNPALASHCSNLLIVVSLDSKQNFYFNCGVVDDRWGDLRIAFPCRCDVEIEDRICSRIDEARDFRLLDRQLRSFREVNPDMAAVTTRGVNPTPPDREQ